MFTTDAQTVADLGIFHKGAEHSLYALYNRTSTRGGAQVLEDMFRYPLNDALSINKRSSIIRYFSEQKINFPFGPELFDIAEHYLSDRDERTRLSAWQQSFGQKISGLVATDTAFKNKVKGITALIAVLKELQRLMNSGEITRCTAYDAERLAVMQQLSQEAFVPLLDTSQHDRPSQEQLAAYDSVLRFRHHQEVRKLLQHIYYLDVYLSVANLVIQKGLAFPKAMDDQTCYLSASGFYHPRLKNAVPNDIEISPAGNVIFLTGANMAGKSTMMKSLGVNIYLAHMGFPVAAQKLDFAVMDGIYTTINLPDNLGMGMSHFYAEVLRLKKVAKELSHSRRLFVIFDELFRGTNVKDAYEGTIAVTEAFARNHSSIFVISTHITEAGEILKERCKNVSFKYLPTHLKQNKPVYTYHLETGITEDRHGMIIVNNEGILEILQDGDQKNQTPKNTTFIADQQTLNDLNLLGKYKPNSIYSLFNRVVTRGGERLLQEMFQNPLTDASEINQRSNLFSYFHQKGSKFPFKKEAFEQVEAYLHMESGNNYLAAIAGTVIKEVQSLLLRDEQYELIRKGVTATAKLLNVCRAFIAGLTENNRCDGPYRDDYQLLNDLLSNPRLLRLRDEPEIERLPFIKVTRYDYLLRHTLQPQMETLMQAIYKLDVYVAVSSVAKEKGFGYALALSKSANLIDATAIWHPGLIKGKANTLSFHRHQNMMFLTGANMAGKSTLMKAFGIAVYLAHMGFPVAAKKMQFSVMDGLYSSINVPDDLNMGYSHFYAEVLRVKKAAEEVAAGKKLVILFDELFKGTNVKDAYDATLAVTKAFAGYRDCFFIISTHIIEVGEALKNSTDNLRFAYLPTLMQGTTPQYTYQLENGITADRQGMIIMENEGILDMIREGTLD